MFHETEANHANLCRVIDCFRGEIHPSREAGPPERPQREPRRPLAQRRPPTGPKKIKAVANPVLHASLPLKPHENQPGDDFAQEFDRCILVTAACVGFWSGASTPKRSQERQPPSRCLQNESAAGRGAPGKAHAVARPVGSQRVFVDLVRHSNLEHNN